jgi:hypothetical protein
MFKIVEEGGNMGDVAYALDKEFATYQGAESALDQNPSYKRDGVDDQNRAFWYDASFRISAWVEWVA